MAGIRPPDNAASPHRRNRLKASNVHYLFSVRNMFFSRIFGAGGPTPGIFWQHPPFPDGNQTAPGFRAPDSPVKLKKLHQYLQHAAEWGIGREPLSLQIASTLSVRWKNTTKVPKMFISMQTSPHNRRAL